MRIILLYTIIVGYFLFVSSVSASTAAGNPPASIPLCPKGDFKNLCIKEDKISQVISNFIIVLFILAVILSIIFLIWGGIKWITAGGDKAGLESARQTIVMAIIGLAIAFAGYFLLNILLFLFGVKEGAFKLPTLTSE